MFNQITLVGRAGGNPVATTFTDTDNKVAKFSLAVAEYSSKVENPKPMWVDVESWNGLADRVMKTITEGREVVITGRLSISKYNKEINGVQVEMKVPVIKLTGFHLCGAKPKAEEEVPTESKPAAKKRKAA
jgi:single stranded DNA-binding protein